MVNLAAKTDQPTTSTFPFVGIGASAGGLEAISQLLSEIPAISGMAFLLVQHLDPTRESLLPEILEKRVSMSVREGAEGMAVEANHLYVIPANTSMSVQGGHIRLRPRNTTPGPPMPIDDLLDSLSKDQGVNAIGIILSGSGSDGALGLQSIHTEGGITFAQDASALFDSMPRAAIGLGCVDRVLSPKAIAHEIIRIGRHPHLRTSAPKSETLLVEPDGPSLRTMFRLLQAACNVDFSVYKSGTIERRLSRRMALKQVASVSDYITLLESDPAERLALGRDFLIQVTHFFRDPQTFDALTQTVFPRLVNDIEAGTTLRL